MGMEQLDFTTIGAVIGTIITGLGGKAAWARWATRAGRKLEAAKANAAELGNYDQMIHTMGTRIAALEADTMSLRLQLTDCEQKHRECERKCLALETQVSELSFELNQHVQQERTP